MCKVECAVVRHAAAAQNRLYSNTEPRQCRSPWQKTLDNVHRNGVIILTAMFVVLWPSTMLKKKPADPKRESLHRHGSLNRRPQDVTDELFIGSDFFDPRDLVQVKYEMLRRVQEDGHAITEASGKFGFSRPSFYQAQAAFQANGLVGLIPRKRGPKKANKLTAEVIEFIQQALQQDASLRSADLAVRVREQFDFAVHPRSIERGLARHQKKLQMPN